MNFRIEIQKEREEEVVCFVHKESTLTDQIEKLVKEEKEDTSIPVFDEEKEFFKRLEFKDITSFSVQSGKTTVVDTKGNTYFTKYKLYELEEMLPQYFLRINKSALANQKEIDHFEVTLSCSVNVIFKCGYIDYVSRRCFKEIKRRMDF